MTRSRKNSTRPAAFECLCGGSIVGHSDRHFKTARHQKYLTQVGARNPRSPFAPTQGVNALNRAKRRAQQRQLQAPAPVVASTPAPVAAPKRKRTLRAKTETIA